MTCIRCLKNPASVHISTRIGDEVVQLDYCQSCARSMHLEQQENVLVPSNIFIGTEGPPESFFPGLTEAESHSIGYILACIEKAKARSGGTGAHVPANVILMVAGEVARDMFSEDARRELKEMGIVSSESLGTTIFAFIEKGVLSKAAEDRIEDFRIRSVFDEFLENA